MKLDWTFAMHVIITNVVIFIENLLCSWHLDLIPNLQQNSVVINLLILNLKINLERLNDMPQVIK